MTFVVGGITGTHHTSLRDELLEFINTTQIPPDGYKIVKPPAKTVLLGMVNTDGITMIVAIQVNDVWHPLEEPFSLSITPEDIVE